MARKFVRITHKKTGEKLVEGPIGWGIMSFEGNYYVQDKYILTEGFKLNWFPGFCPYKFFYFWADLALPDGTVVKNLAWKYVIANPIFPFIWFRIGIPQNHPEITVEEYEAE